MVAALFPEGFTAVDRSRPWARIMAVRSAGGLDPQGLAAGSMAAALLRGAPLGAPPAAGATEVGIDEVNGAILKKGNDL